MFSINKIISNIVLLFLLLVVLNLRLYGDAAVKRYYNNETKKMQFHLGFGVGIGYSWYMNYSDENFFLTYSTMIKLFQEVSPGKIGLAMAVNTDIERITMTDNDTYYGLRYYQNINYMVGIRMVYDSFIPFTQYIAPYFLVGGGVIFGDYNSYVRVGNKAFSSWITAFGYSVETIVGTEIYIIPTLLAVDVGLKFHYNLGIDVNNVIDDDFILLKESLTEQVFNFYMGFSYYVF